MARLSDETNGIHMGFKRTVVGILWDYMGISCCSAKKHYAIWFTMDALVDINNQDSRLHH